MDTRGRTTAGWLALAGTLAAAAILGMGSSPAAQQQQEQTATKPADAPAKAAASDPLPDFRKGEKNSGPNNQPPYDRLNEYGVLPSSAFQDGGTFLPWEQRVPEVFQHLDPREQIPQGRLLGSQLPPVLLEFRFVTKEVAPGGEVRAVARVAAANKPRPFTALFFHQEHGRATAAVYINFEASKKEPGVFLGRGQIPKYLAPGPYVIQDAILGDENGHRKAYMAEFFPVLQEPDGSPVHFIVSGNDNVDMRPPVLTRLELAESRARVGQNIHLSVWVEDDKSGPSEAQAYWTSPSGAQSLRADLVSVPGEPGLFRSSFQIPEFYEGGDWRLLSLKISDKATNEVHLFPPSVPMMRDVRVSIDQDPSRVDKTAPRLLAVQLSHDDLPRDKELAITILAEDDGSGMKEAYISFLAPHGVDFNRVTLTNDAPDLRRRSAGPQPNVWRGTLKLKATQEPGRWTVSRVNLADRANNYSNYNAVRDELLRGLGVTFLDPRMKKGPSTTDGRH